MIQDGLATGALRPGKTIIDATSGNTGIAYAMVAAALGYPVQLCLPDSASHERKRILAALGAELVITPGDEGTDGAIRKVHQIVAANPDKYFYPDQYSNPANWQAHYRTTANEIWQQTSGRITHFVAGLGTSGTFVGTTRRLKELNPAVRCVSLQPDASFHGLEGWKHMPTAIRPAIYDDKLADENLPVSTEEAYGLVKRMAREEGLLVSPSAAAALLGCFQVAAGIPKNVNAVIVTVFADSASKYLNALWISGQLAEKIRAHGAETYPHECCGALLGRDSNAVLESDRGDGSLTAAREILGLFPLVNRRNDSPRNRFSVTAEDVMAAERAAREQGLEVVGWYHSHPDHPARPSEFDRDHAWPWYSYVIVSVQNGAPQDMTSWRLNDDRAEFSPEGIEIRHRAAV
jgi:cysteine synthase B